MQQCRHPEDIMEKYFKDAIWVGSKNRTAESFSILRDSFELDGTETATLNVIGLGFFKCYVNGICINPDTFLPLSSDFEATCDPKGETLSAHRVYVSTFDISPYVTSGKNVIAVIYGGGWYTSRARVFGLPKVIFSIDALSDGVSKHFASGEHCKIGSTYICGYNFVKSESHDYTEWEDAVSPDFDDSAWEYACATEPLQSEYCVTDCPKDALIRTLDVKPVKKSERGAIYDCGKNTSGYPVIKLKTKKGEQVRVIFSEELTSEGSIDVSHSHGQEFSVISDGSERVAQPEFTWFGFRYFEIIGEAEPICVKEIHADVPCSSFFECDNAILNWTYNTFVHTMLCNMHTGHPSDCPHIERRGYTGDGQLTCHAVFTVLDAKAFYEKWMQDIADSQDIHSGHVQYTAPYVRSGGGPGGWGGAIVFVPFWFYKHYGDVSVLEKYYENMRKYVYYLEEHSEYGLVTSDKQGEWCLGDWCCPNVLYPDKDITSHNQQVILPAPMINTYFMVKALDMMAEIAVIIGKDSDVKEYKDKSEYRRRAINAAYFNTFDNNFIMNVQGANAFAVDIGLGNASTYKNMVRYYTKTGCFDTGIFGTDVLTRVLFENGDHDLALSLFESEGVQGFGHWMKNGATTFHEYWDSNRSRSHNHPMFGAVVAYFFEYLLGIRQAKESAGYASVIIEPLCIDRFDHMSGGITTPNGLLSVKYAKSEGGIQFSIVIPHGTEAIFKQGESKIALDEGENSFFLQINKDR